ncbi:hypothetical protein FisN_8Lh150 [Fistulifera solaris]|uniref:Fe2OG dioxygenase domain-containing protein n=1 Tax=Fistulifera solaris TaxID=1519565 RepID=A0A1Z5JDF4_FISSO|nr:hypothetical protein FisN_8Lh150 [Fistulifera solaris]|eukprot:GAX12050.1 hypothetical protein FisN_8Lh150 [Fistulifera solaris]
MILTAQAPFAWSYAPFSPRSSSSIFPLYATDQSHDKITLAQENLLCSIQDILQIDKADWKERQTAIMSRIAQQIQEDFDASNLAKEDKQLAASTFVHPPDFEWVCTTEPGYRLVAQSLQPIMDHSDVITLQNEAESAWCTGQTSRFTYQRPGNYEVHVTDLSTKAQEIVNDCLRNSIYPWIQTAFGPFRETLHVYDALIIRYNATEAMQSGAAVGAGQPLHRDLGLVSINVMLNEDFVGGGTFFENQLEDEESFQPVKPLGVGHAIAHYSSERHAGSATLQGVRDILVIFVSGNEAAVKTAMLKQCRSICEAENDDDIVGGTMCRICHQLMAVELSPHDGEAWQYLGSSLMDFSTIPFDQASQKMVLACALSCFDAAVQLTPCDSRNYNNMGVVNVRLAKFASSVDLRHEYLTKAELAYQKGWELLTKFEQVGCDVTADFDYLTLNYGLLVANQDRFAEACSILQLLAASVDGRSDSQIAKDAYMLYSFCQKHVPQQ